MTFNNQWLLDDVFDAPAPPPDSPLRPVRPTPLQRLKNSAAEMVQVFMVAFVMYLGLNVAIPRYEVQGASMEPNFHTAERVVVSKVHYQLTDPARGDIIVFHQQRNLIKRIVGLPGETVALRNGRVYINDALLSEDYVQNYCTIGTCRDSAWALGPDEYFVLGDNRRNSHDSHNFGPIARDQIVGRVVLRYYPFEEISTFLDSVY